MEPTRVGDLLAAGRVVTMSSIMGELVTETLEFDGGRKVTAYVPAGAPQAVVFAGDGQLISQWGGFLEEADLPPTLIVGVHRTDHETLRLHEYSPKFDPERFTAHERFFVQDVRRWTDSRFGFAPPLERTAVFGFRQVESWHSPWDCGIRMCTERSSAPHRERVTDPRRCCRVPCRGRTWWPAVGSRSSSRTRPSGRRHCARQVRMSS